MSDHKAVASRKNTVVIRMCKSHRISVLTLSAFLIIFMLVTMMSLVSLAEFGLGMDLFLCTIAIIPFLPLPFYYATWQITFNANGIQKRLFWINLKSHSWTQVKEVHSAWSSSDKIYISIIFKDRKTIRFRMDCENAEKARKLILSHCSIVDKW